MKKKLPLLTIITVALILTAVIFPASALPEGPEIPGLDKFAHAVMFFTLAAAMHLDYGLHGRMRLFCAFAFALPFAGFTEIIQRFSVNRSTELLDFAADILGFCLGILLRKPCSSAALKIGRNISALKKRSRT